MTQDLVRQVLRADDDEVLGRVVRDGAAWRAETIFGGLLAHPVPTSEEAEATVRADGLSALAEPWWFAPASGEWRLGWFLEVRQHRVKVSWDDPRYSAGVQAQWLDAHDWSITRLPPA